MYERGFIVAAEGNLSVRLDNARILTTPTCMNKGMLRPEDLVITDLVGRRLGGTRKASSELGMHLLFYRMRPDVNAICHAHPPTATGFAAAGRGLDRALLPEVVVGLGQIPLVQYATPGTPEWRTVRAEFAQVPRRPRAAKRGRVRVQRRQILWPSAGAHDKSRSRPAASGKIT